MRFAYLAAFVYVFILGCEQGPEPVEIVFDEDHRDAVANSPSHDETTPRVRTVVFERGTRDERFIGNSASAARMNIELGRIAQRRSADNRVKQFGRRMIDDHQKAERDLMDVASARDITVPPGMTPTHRYLVGQVAPLSGDEFDREYVRVMVGEHLGLVREYDDESRNALDLHVRDFAEQNLSILRDHLQKARSLSDALKLKVENEDAGGPGAARETDRASPSLY